MFYILAFLAGALTLISMITNSNLAKYIGTVQSSLVNFSAGLIVSVVLYFAWNNQAFKLLDIPVWIYFGGFLGIFIVILSNNVIPKIPTIYTTLLIFIGQLLTSLIIDFIQTGNLASNKLIGALIIISGLFYNFMVDKNEKKKLKVNNLKYQKSI